MAYVVISCPGGLTDYNAANFGGRPFQAPNTYLNGEPDWQNGLFDFNNTAATADMNRLYDLMFTQRNTLNGLRVFGHSRGGQIIYKLLRERLADLVANFNPARLLLISSGNPERKHNGVSWLRPDFREPVYPGPAVAGPGAGYGLPTAGVGPFTVIDIARQYDEWADYPNDWAVTAATDAIGSADVHSAYDGCPPLGADGWPTNWDDWTHHQEGNVHYLTAPANSLVTPAPPTTMARLHGGKPARNRIRQTQYLDSRNPTRAGIEIAYNRPVPVLARVS